MSEIRSVFFVCSSALHVKLFASTICRVALTGRIRPVIVSLDTFYAGIHGNVAAYAEELQLPAVIVDAGFSRGNGGGLLARIYAANRDGMRAMLAIFAADDTGLVVLGNDTGHAERVVIAAARILGVPTLLVQDGFLFDQFSEGFFGTLRLTVRRFWLALGGDRLGWVPYGMGGSDAIAVHGIGWLEMIYRVKRRVTRRVEVTGQPTLIRPDDLQVVPPAGKDVLFFCSNFLSAHKDAAAHQHQIGEILVLRKLLMDRYGDNVVLHVKLHPADRLEEYTALTSMSGITLHKDVALNDLIQKSWLCVTNISSVSVDCVTAGRVCLMSGISLRSASYRRLFARLPGTKFVTWDAFSSWLDKLDSVAGYAQVLAMQREGLDIWVGDSRRGAERLEALIDELAGAAGAMERNV